MQECDTKKTAEQKGKRAWNTLLFGVLLGESDEEEEIEDEDEDEDEEGAKASASSASTHW